MLRENRMPHSEDFMPSSISKFEIFDMRASIGLNFVFVFCLSSQVHCIVRNARFSMSLSALVEARMIAPSLSFGFAWDIYPVEIEGARALKFEVVLSPALCSLLIALTIALASYFWVRRGRCGRHSREADTDVAAICISRTGRKYHKVDSSCARHAVAYYSACMKCYPELKEERPIAVFDQVGSGASRGF